MKTIDIKYNNLSKDYNRLYDLLKQNYIIVGFCSLDIECKIDNDYSECRLFSYNSKYQYFDIIGTMFESDFNKEKTIKMCENYNVKYFDIK